MATPATKAPSAETGARRISHGSRRRIDFGVTGGSTLVIANGTIPSASKAPATLKAERIRREAAQGELPAGRGGESDDLVDAVKRAAVGVVGLGVDPGFDHRVDAGEDEAERARGRASTPPAAPIPAS